MTNIVAFLTARFDEDEQWAKWARTVIAGRWDCWEVVVQQAWACCDTVPNIGRIGSHLQYYADPDRVMREVVAKRRMLTTLVEMRAQDSWGFHAFAKQLEHALAAPYANHPDYDPAWKLDAPH